MASQANISGRGDSASKSAKALALPDAEQLHKMFRYERQTGRLYYRERSASDFHGSTSPEKSAAHFNRTYAGSCLNAKNLAGYILCRISGRSVFAHRVIWKMVHGFDPEVIDHINGDPSDNRIENLRNVTPKGNARNARLRANNATGMSGIWEQKPKASGARWKVVKSEAGRIVGTKVFKCIGEAVRYRNADLKKRGFTASHGIRTTADNWTPVAKIAAALVEQARRIREQREREK